MSTISTGSLPTRRPASTTRPYRARGLAVVAAGLVLSGGGAAVVHHWGNPDGTYAGEIATELVAAALGYLVAYGLGWWRPARSAARRTVAARTALVLALLGALLVPICFWNPMPLTFAASALMLKHWSRETPPDAASANQPLERVVSVVANAVIAVQVVLFVGHVISSV